MRNSTSILSLLLAVGIYGAGPIVTKFGPFAATVAYAEGSQGGEGGDGDGGDSGDGDSDDGGDSDDDDSDNTDSGTDDVTDAVSAKAPCVVDCNEN